MRSIFTGRYCYAPVTHKVTLGEIDSAVAVAADSDTEMAAESESPDGAVSEEAGAVSDDTAQSEGSAE